MRLIGALLALALSATVDASAQASALLVVAVEGMSTSDREDYSFTFQRVDLTASVFLEETVRVTFSGSPLASSDELRKPDTMETLMRFAAVALPAGDYALVFRTHRRRAGRDSSDVETCYSYGAPVFAIRDGVTNLVPEDDFSEQEAEAQFRTLLPAHPGINAPIHPAERLGHVSFGTTRTPGQEGRVYCRSEGRFSFRPPLRPTQPH